MKIYIYWSESNSWIYFYKIYKKKLKNISGPNKFLLVLGPRTGAHCEDDCMYYGLYFRKYLLSPVKKKDFLLNTTEVKVCVIFFYLLSYQESLRKSLVFDTTQGFVCLTFFFYHSF